MFERPWTGVFAAILCPFRENESIDEGGMHAYAADVAGVAGIEGLVVNGHTGEIVSLLPEERARTTRIVAEAVARKAKVVSGVMAEGSAEAVVHARAAGADAILLMPPHHWLRFGRKSETEIGFLKDVARAVDVSVVVHQYPAWTKACYSLDEMLELVKVPNVVSIKMGTRDMARWGEEYRRLKQAAPEVSILSCHDEYLLATLLDGADGALVGFAGFAPELVVELVRAALGGARPAQEKLRPLARIVYRLGEPSGDAHQRMKCACWLMGRFPLSRARSPLRPLGGGEVARIRRELNEAAFETVR